MATSLRPLAAHARDLSSTFEQIIAACDACADACAPRQIPACRSCAESCRQCADDCREVLACLE